MPDVFISYRRAEGLAVKLLHEALAERFDVFFDIDRKSIKLGEPFPDALRRALADCRVVVVIIGPEWVSDANLKRLQDPTDWVKVEIETALRAAGVRVIPVLLDGVSPKTLEALDDPLRRLTSLEQLSLTLDTFDDRIGQLVDDVDGWLREPARPPQRVAPPLLPQLCDRVPPEDRLIEQFTGEGLRSKMPVVLVHGHKWEDHLGFLDRLKYRRVLADVLGGAAGVTIEPLQWDVDRAAAGEHEKALIAAVRRNVLKSTIATRESIAAYFESVRQPHCLVLALTAEECARCGPELIPKLLAAWEGLFQVQREGLPVAVEPPHPVVLWINLSYGDLGSAPDVEALLKDAGNRAVALPTLGPIRESDVSAWLKLDEVEPFVGRKGSAILGLLDDPALHIEKGRMHMRRFADAVNGLLAQADDARREP
jgi:hypothetical protein